PTASRADGKLTRQMRLGAGRERGDLLMPNVDPLDHALATHCIGQTIEAVAYDAIDPPDSCGREVLHELVSDCFRHGVPRKRAELSNSVRNMRSTTATGHPAKGGPIRAPSGSSGRVRTKRGSNSSVGRRSAQMSSASEARTRRTASGQSSTRIIALTAPTTTG